MPTRTLVHSSCGAALQKYQHVLRSLQEEPQACCWKLGKPKIWQPVSRLLQVWEIPEAWSLRDAATVPVAYMTAYYSLIMRGGLEPGHRVLVHSGTGAVGLAAIRICLHRGCEVGLLPSWMT